MLSCIGAAPAPWIETCVMKELHHGTSSRTRRRACSLDRNKGKGADPRSSSTAGNATERPTDSDSDQRPWSTNSAGSAGTEKAASTGAPAAQRANSAQGGGGAAGEGGTGRGRRQGPGPEVLSRFSSLLVSSADKPEYTVADKDQALRCKQHKNTPPHLRPPAFSRAHVLGARWQHSRRCPSSAHP